MAVEPATLSELDVHLGLLTRRRERAQAQHLNNTVELITMEINEALDQRLSLTEGQLLR
jgi:hypothetical protein